jgi:hypothetical protein
MNEPVELAKLTKPTRPLWRRIVKWILCIAVTLIVLLVVAWSTWNYLATRDLQAEVQKIRAAGEPVTFAQLAEQRPKPSEDQDAAPYYGAALLLQRNSEQLWDALAKCHEIAEDRQAELPADLVASIQDLLAQNGLALEMIDRGGALPACDFDIGVEHGIGSALAKLGKAGGPAKLCSLRTAFLAMQGQSDRAAESAMSTLRMTRMFDAQPIVIACLLKVACLAMTAGDVPVILEHGSPSRSSLDRLQEALLEAEQTIDLRRVWLAERVYCLEVMRNLFSDRRELQAFPGDRPSMPETWPTPFASGPFVRRMAAAVLRKYAASVTMAGKDWPEALAAAHWMGSTQPRSWLSPNLMADVLGPSLSKAMELSARSVADLRCARVAVLVDMYRLDMGHLPQTLADVESSLGVKLPSDPFTGGALIYRKTADGYLVYSLGESRQDQGGPSPKRDESGNRGYRIHLTASGGTEFLPPRSSPIVGDSPPSEPGNNSH